MQDSCCGIEGSMRMPDLSISVYEPQIVTMLGALAGCQHEGPDPECAR